MFFAKVEFVGYEISNEGTTFSDKQKDKVKDFPLPGNTKALRTFLGLANWYRSHIKDHSIETYPLYQMIDGSNRKKPLSWSQENIKVFENIRKKILECPILYWKNPELPVHLATDACDYGIGAHLYQLEGKKEKTIRFLSKTLVKAQLAWSFPEKEAYAMFYAILKLDHLLRGIKFTVHTDHKNLLCQRFSTITSDKVMRWKLRIQEYNYDVEYIKGEENIVADAMSRLCVISIPHENLLDEFHIPEEYFEKIKRVHNEVVGHHGVEATLVKLEKNNESWMYMRKHVQQFIKNCPLCQKINMNKIITNTKPFTVARYEPMECLNIDYIGPLKSNQDGSHYGYVLNVIDCFTRFIELYPVEKNDATSTAECLLQHFGRYGAPAQIRSDRGSHFVNEVIQDLLQIAGVEQLLTLAYSKEENALVERANKEVKRHLEAILFDRRIKDDYESCLPLVQRIMNASVHSAIGVSPAQLLFGNAIDLDRNLFSLREIENGEQNLSEWAEQMLNKQTILLNLARKHQRETDLKKISVLDKNNDENITEYPVNSYVHVKHNTDPSSKFQPFWKGPMRVVSFKNSTYTIQDLHNGKNENVHITRLKPFYYDPKYTDPEEVVNKEKQTYEIEKVIGHKGNKRSKSRMTFTVKWVGYDQPTEGEPWEQLRNTKALHEYLRSKHMASLIPRKFKEK